MNKKLAVGDICLWCFESGYITLRYGPNAPTKECPWCFGEGKIPAKRVEINARIDEYASKKDGE